MRSCYSGYENRMMRQDGPISPDTPPTATTSKMSEGKAKGQGD